MPVAIDVAVFERLGTRAVILDKPGQVRRRDLPVGVQIGGATGSEDGRFDRERDRGGVGIVDPVGSTISKNIRTDKTGIWAITKGTGGVQCQRAVSRWSDDRRAQAIPINVRVVREDIPH